MFKLLKKITILLVAIAMTFTFTFGDIDTPLSQVDTAYAGGGETTYHDEDVSKEYNYIANMGSSVRYGSSDPTLGNKTYAMVFETGERPGDMVEFIMLRCIDSKGNYVYRRINPNYEYAGGNYRLSQSRDGLYQMRDSYSATAQMYRLYYSNYGNYEYYNLYQTLNQKYKDVDSLISNLDKAVDTSSKYANLYMGSYVDVARTTNLSQQARNSLYTGRRIFKSNSRFVKASDASSFDDFINVLKKNSVQSAKKGTGGSSSKAGSTGYYGELPSLFSSNTTTTLTFQFDLDAYRLDSICLYAKESGNLDMWDVNSWALYELSSGSTPELCMYSNVSDQTYLQFTGKKIYEVTNIAGEGISIDSVNNEQESDNGTSFMRIPVEGEAEQIIGREAISKKLVASADSMLSQDVLFDNITKAPTMPRGRKYPRVLKYTKTVVGQFANDKRDKYTVEIKIPDVIEAGFELANKKISKTGSDVLNLQEQLIARINYQSGDYINHTLTIPVMTNALIKAINSGNMEDNIAKFERGEILSFAQQGDSLLFDLNLPNCMRIIDIELENKAADVSTQDERINVNAIRVYRSSEVLPVYNYDGTLYGYMPDNYKTVCGTSYQNYEGMTIYLSDKADFIMNNRYDGSVPARPAKDKYLVTLTTSNIDICKTVNDIRFALKYTNTKKQDNCYTQEYNIGQACQEYYGYWPGVDSKGNIVNGALRYGLRPGGEISFIISCNDVSEFTGLSMKFNDDVTVVDDDWQLQDISIKRITAFDDRRQGGSVQKQNADYYNVDLSKAEKTITVNDVTVDRYYYHNIQGDNMGEYRDLELLLQKNRTVDYDFVAKKAQEEEQKRDFTEYYYSMSYEMANRDDLGFTDTAKTYTVRVDIPENKTKATVDDGCGSDNLFYFQLVFNRGESGYVLANNQMTTDGFVAGTTASFSIRVNEDLGDVVAVNIIPDDLDENGDILDKLCVNKIEVIKNNYNGILKRFVIENVGWIEREYHSNDQVAEKKRVIGRPYDELVCTYSVGYSAYQLKYEVAITTTQPQGVQDASLAPQYEGPLYADICYFNAKGELKFIYGFDVAEAIYQYNGKDSKIKDGKVVTDPELMLRPNSTDRFFLELSDAVEINYIKFIFEDPTETVDWTISSIAVSVVTSASMLKVNASGEYQMKYSNPDDPQLICNKLDGTNLPCTIRIKAGSKTTRQFTFAENHIPMLDDDAGVVNVVPRVPESQNDTANIYVFLNKDATDPDKYGHSLKATMYYSGLKADYNALTTLTWSKLDDVDENGKPFVRHVAYREGISARAFNTLNDINIKSSVVADASRHDLQAPVQTVVVQQVRNGVVIDTFVLGYNNGDPCLITAGVSKGSINNSTGFGEKQEIEINLGPQTTEATLNPSVYDVAVAFDYTSKNDLSGKNTIFTSPYVYLSDQEIKNIQAGQTVKVQFHEAYVNNIKAIRFGATGGLKADIDSAVVTAYNRDGTMANIYAVEKGGVVVQGTSKYDITAGGDTGKTITPVTLSFKTADAQVGSDAGTSKPVTVDINYVDTKGISQVYTILDATAQVGGSFGTGTEKSFTVLLTNLDSIRTIDITPTASWTVDTVSVTEKANSKTETKSVMIGKTIVKDSEYNVNLCDIIARVNVVTGNENKTVDNDELSLLVASGASVSLKIDMIDTLSGKGFYYQIDEVNGDSVKSYQSQKLIQNSSDIINLTLPANTTGETKTYRVTVTSEESPLIQSIVYLKVEPSGN